MPIPVISIVFFGVFLIISFVEIVVAFNEKEKLRKTIKPFCLLFLGLTALTLLPDHPLIYIGAFVGMIGDMFLIWKKPRIFMMGTAAFLAGHICYISEILFIMMKDDPMPWWFYVSAAFAILLIVIAAYPFSKKITKHRSLALFGNFYLSTLLLLTTISLIASVRGFGDYMVLGVVGGIAFLASDLILTSSTFIRDFRRRDYYIMLFYLIGQVGIVLGLALTYVL